jgi:hypothetical protein
MINLKFKMEKKYSTSYPNFLEDEYSNQSQMGRNERYAFIKLLEIIKPKVAIEIGCFKGGSLEVMSKYCEKVYSFDINPEVKSNFENNFKNVEFHIGKSEDLVPKVLKKIDSLNETLEFVLIDGDHSFKGVQKDILSFLNYTPKNRIYIIFHDSFNPICRKAIVNLNYNHYLHIIYLELDFISGVFLTNEKLFREMWGGLALMILDEGKRKEKLIINQCQKMLFENIYWKSIHPLKDNLIFLKPLIKKYLMKTNTNKELS